VGLLGLLMTQMGQPVVFLIYGIVVLASMVFTFYGMYLRATVDIVGCVDACAAGVTADLIWLWVMEILCGFYLFADLITIIGTCIVGFYRLRRENLARSKRELADSALILPDEYDKSSCHAKPKRGGAADDDEWNEEDEEDMEDEEQQTYNSSGAKAPENMQTITVSGGLKLWDTASLNKAW